MIAARPIPAVKPDRSGGLAVAPVPTDPAGDHPLRLADALSAGAAPRFHSDEISPPIAAIIDSSRANFTQAPRGASGGAGGSQP